MRNRDLHHAIQAYVTEAASALETERAAGAEIPFEISERTGGRGRPSLYCYRPLTRPFIAERRQRLADLPAHPAAVEALAGLEGTTRYLEHHGVVPLPAQARQRAEATVETFLGQLFADRNDFSLEPERLGSGYEELEALLYEDHRVATVLAPLLGLSLAPDTQDLTLDDGLRLVRGETFEDVPAEAVWGAAGTGLRQEPSVLAVLTLPQERAAGSPVAVARTRFRRVLSALRLFERGSYALAPTAWMRSDGGAWREAALGSGGRSGLVTLIPAEREGELAAFCELLNRRGPLPSQLAGPEGELAEDRSGAGELAWALARFEMGCERLAPLEALSDYLLALRALLEPEGPQSGRLSQRLAVLCAPPERRGPLAERIARTISLERAVIRGTTPTEGGGGTLVLELSEHLRALLRDVICGHLDADLCGLADELLEEDVTRAA